VRRDGGDSLLAFEEMSNFFFFLIVASPSSCGAYFASNLLTLSLSFSFCISISIVTYFERKPLRVTRGEESGED